MQRVEPSPVSVTPLPYVVAMFAKTISATLVGVDAQGVSVEAHVDGRKDVFSLVGLPDTAIREARDRVRAAIRGSSFRFPTNRVIVSLAPAELPKSGSSFDLPIALGILVAAGLVDEPATRVVSIGELGLDGTVRPARGAIAAAKVARDAGLPCLVPAALAEQAARVEGADIRPVRSLVDAVNQALSHNPRRPGPARPLPERSLPDLAEVTGQSLARRALEISAAGGHHLLMVGPPGCGKTMLARRLPSILPPLTPEESLSVALVWEAADRARPVGDTIPPFRAPHHSASAAGLLGGGAGMATPGEISLAHHGVLFLDELGEFPASHLDSLRQPIEDGNITLSRRGVSVTYPTDMQVVAATNPCPCGYRGDRKIPCQCGDGAVEKYRRRLSGPLLDRFDLRVRVERPDLSDRRPGEASSVVAERVARARRHQSKRGLLNRNLGPSQLDAMIWTDAARRRLARLATDDTVGPRSYDRLRRLARTIADLQDEETVGEEAVLEALALRAAI